ncbi:MAG: ABC transporter permease [Actinobacteria bacterium]|nr:ABC transporter permease [Actinomycetota bacterium]
MSTSAPNPPRASTWQAALRYLRDLWSRREFVWYMAMGNVKARNASTTLGLLWWVLNPLLLGAIYFFVFGVLLGIARDLGHLLSGMFVFYFTSASLTGGANSIISNSRLLANLSFPRLAMPVVAVTEAAIGFLVSIPVLYLIIGPTSGTWPGIEILWLFPIIFIVQTIFNLGLASLSARLAVPFRDINNLLPYVNRLWLYVSPIIYTAAFVEERAPAPWDRLYNLNPMVPLLSVYRSALLGSPFDMTMLLMAGLWAIGVGSIAIVMFVKYEGRMARYL